MSIKFNQLALAIGSISLVPLTHAAGLDRSIQPSWGFTQEGTLAYVEHITIDPTIEGRDNAHPNPTSSNYVEGNQIPNMADNYQFTNFGAKADVNDRVSVGVFFDQPWGADAQYVGENDFVNAKIPASEVQKLGLQAKQALTAAQQAGAAYQANPADLSLAANYKNAVVSAKRAGAAYNLANDVYQNPNEGTNVTVSSENITGLLGAKLGDNKNIQIYGGPTLQKLEGEVHLRGNAYNLTQGYDAYFKPSKGYGWMAGVAYSKPEIALKAALTYRSEIDHETSSHEYMPASGVSDSNDITITTPQSVNLDFQTGLNKTTLLTAKLRWVPWSDFFIKPKVYNDSTKQVTGADGKPVYPNGLNLVDYSDDAWSAEVGLGKKLSDKWGFSGSVGWDSGAGNPTTSLGPVEGNWNVGVGAKYNITPEWSVSGGAKYLMFGDAKAKIPNQTLVGNFTDNDGAVYGLRLTYQKK